MDFIINTKYAQGETGAGLKQRMQVMSVAEKEPGTRFAYIAEAVLFAGRFAFVAPDTQVDYGSASTVEKAAFGFIAPNSGNFADDGTPYKII